jgi:hypothetical protein
MENINGLPLGNHHEDLPDIVAIIELGKPALPRSLAEAGEGAQDHIFFIGSTPRRTGKLPASALDGAEKMFAVCRLSSLFLE